MSDRFARLKTQGDREVDLAVAMAAFVALSLFLSWLQLFLSSRLTAAPLELAAALLAVVDVAHGLRTNRLGKSLVLLATALGTWVLSVAIAAWLFDISFDGTAYHQVAVIALAKGWNPVVVPHMLDWWNPTFPADTALAGTISQQGLWIDHYPKASWVLGAEVFLATGSLNAAKWLHPFLAILAFLVALRGLKAADLAAAWAVCLAAVAVLSPVAIAQFGTNYVDGLLASALLIQIGAALSWLIRRRSSDLILLLVGVVLACGLKFTGVVYAAMLLALTLAAALNRNGWPSRTDAMILGAGAALLAITSGQTYAHNLATHGHPFYPINAVGVLEDQAPAAFLQEGRFRKFLSASFPLAGDERDLRPTVAPTLPRLWHYQVLVRSPDTRAAGFGSLFIWSLLACFAALAVVCFMLRRQPAQNSIVPLMLLIAWVIASSLVNPEGWWARFVPQLWLLPILVAALARLRQKAILALAVFAFAATGSLLTLVFWLQATIKSQVAVREALQQISTAGRVVVLQGWNKDAGTFTFVHHARLRDADVSFSGDAARCNTDVGIVRVCSEKP